MKKFVRLAACSLALVLTISSVSARSAGFDGLDAKNADAGASLLLQNYLEKNANASEKLAGALAPLQVIDASRPTVEGAEVSRESLDEVLYETPQLGVACVESSLNVRASSTLLSEVVTKVYRNENVMVIGEKKSNGYLWYRVSLNGVEGYCMADYIRYGDEAAEFYSRLHEMEKSAAAVPESLTVYENMNDFGVPADIQETLRENVKQINYCLKNDYPTQAASGEYMNMYSILIYLLEYYQRVKDVAVEYKMIELQAQCNIDTYAINLTRETLQDTTGQSDEQLQAAIEEARRQRLLETAVGFGTSIADYAATFVGSLPYVWGGASLRSGADCSGFCAQIYAHFGLIDQGTANCHGLDSTALRSVGYAVDVKDIIPGDLVCYNGHVGIYYGNGMIVHEPSIGKKCSFGYLYGLPIVCVRRLHNKQ